jgi:glycosyltransferase involved in cell wall biosynthesis
MSGATIYLYLERDVPFGLTPLEAGSVGAPVVAFEGGGVEETVIDGENGRKVPSSWGADEIAGLLLELLSSPETLKLMGDTGRRRALRWTWHGAYERFSQLIDERPRGRGRPRFESRR